MNRQPFLLTGITLLFSLSACGLIAPELPPPVSPIPLTDPVSIPEISPSKPVIVTLSTIYPTQTPRAGWPPGKIVFTCQAFFRKQASEQVCMIAADDPGTAQSMTYGSQHYYASLAPDGWSMVYSGFREEDLYEIYELGWAEGNPDPLKQLTERLGVLNAPEISPDGSKIVFARHGSEADLSEIWLMERDGMDPHQIIDGTGWDPTWSPDGKQILFASDRGGGIQLWVVGLDGSGLRQISDLPAIRGRSDWSPDGRYIVTDSGEPWDHEIYLMNSDGSNAHRITSPGGNSQGASFSPDSRWVAFTAYFDHPNDPDGCEIYIMRIDGSDLRRMTDNTVCDYQPRWGP